MKIGIDVDGVLTDFEWFLDFYAKKYFKSSVINTTEYNFSKRFNCSTEEETKFYKKYLWWYITKMPIREGVANVLQKLKSEGHSIYVITARYGANKDNILGQYMRYKLIHWLKKNDVVFDGIYYVSTTNAAFEKTEIAKKLEIDYFIEDDPENIKALGAVCNVIGIASSYNSNVKCTNVLDFEEAYTVIHDGFFEQIHYKERKSLTDEQQRKYFQELKKFYCNLPFCSKIHKRIENRLDLLVDVCKWPFNYIANINYIGTAEIDEKEPTIYVFNHRRSMDIAIGYWVLKKIRPRLLIKYEYKGHLLGILLEYMGAVFVNRDNKISGKQAQNILIRTLLNNKGIFLFPEGTRNKTSEVLLPFKLGAVYIAQITGAPIVPIVIKKTGKRRYSVAIGDKRYISYKDDLINKNEELYECMRKQYTKY